MRLPVAVVDTTLLLRLQSADLADLLPLVFSQVRVPDAVLREIGAGPGKVRNRVRNLMRTQADFFVRCEVEDEFVRNWWAAELDLGEAAVLAQAQELKATAIVDERKGTEIARRASVACISSGAILVKLKKAGWIPSVVPFLGKLRTHGFHLSDRDFEAIVRAAGEKEDEAP